MTRQRKRQRGSEPECDMLDCMGGPLDGEQLSSSEFPDVQPWGGEGIYIRTPRRWARPFRYDVLDPLTDLLKDVWVWRGFSPRSKRDKP